ncbi:MAG: cox cluster protein [Natronomonas sp.]
MTDGVGGRRVIAILYVVVVGIAGFMGAAIGSIGLRDLEPVSVFGLVTFQPTPTGLAAFRMKTVGVTLGVVLALVVFVSRRYPDA